MARDRDDFEHAWRDSSTDALQDLRRRRTALDVLAIGGLIAAAAAWAWSSTPSPHTCGGKALDRSPEPAAVMQPAQVVTPVELVEAGEVHTTR